MSEISKFKKQIKQARIKSDQEFFYWFNRTKTPFQLFDKAWYNFCSHVLYPAGKYLVTPEKKIAVEIGYGGGRLTYHASQYFKKVFGLDIHDEQKIVLQKLRSKSVKNVQLLKIINSTFPIKDDTIDFVYSLIVFQHLGDISIFKKYIRESYRILKTNGIAVIYFGRWSYFSLNHGSRTMLKIDTILENLFVKKGFSEKNTRTNDINLILSMNKAQQICTEVGFKVNQKVVSRREDFNMISTFGNQYGLILQKP